MPQQKPIFDTALNQPLSQDEVQQNLETLPHWTQEGDTIVRAQTFHNYLDALQFVNKVGFAAEQNNHHPDIIMKFKSVEIRYTTHSALGLTSLDFKMAKIVEGILSGLIPSPLPS